MGDQSPYPDAENQPTAAPDDGDTSSIQVAPTGSSSGRCNHVCCQWWVFIFCVVFMFIFGIACLAVSAARLHDPGIAFGVLVLIILIIYAAIYRRNITLCKTRCRGSPDPHIDEAVGRARSFLKGLLLVTFLLVAFVFSLIAFILTAIAWESPDPHWNGIPGSCPTTHYCARVAYPSVNVPGVPPTYNTTSQAIIAAASQWIKDEDDENPNDYTSTTVLKNNGTFIHARFVNGFWGFTDDFAVQCYCDNGGTTVLGHSQSRVTSGGSGNEDVNAEHLNEFFDWLYTQSANLPPGPCY